MTFRLAFEGKLGNTFPLERLVALGHVQSHGDQPAVRTLTWNVDPWTYGILLRDGYGDALSAVGYERDRVQVLMTGDRCPAIVP
ncbi:MAG: hypothetical protein JO110_30095 [Acetobacteraceae bacterium]|nr:hypothetical protein [Acetobacteraceae bacterium]